MSNSPAFGKPKWIAIGASVFILAVIGWADYITPARISFMVLYLIPICITAWFAGFGAGVFMSIAATLTALCVNMTQADNLGIDGWNTGMRFGVYLTICALVNHAHAPDRGKPVPRRILRALIWGTATACLLYTGGNILQRQWNSNSSIAQAAPISNAPANDLRELASLVDTSLQISRPVLLGSRDASGPSCVPDVHTGDIKDKVPANPGDWDGGPGTAMAMIYFFDRQNINSPEQDFQWHQGRLKRFLQNEEASNRPAGVQAHELAVRAQQFADAAATWKSWPDHLDPVGYTRNNEWAAYCMAALDKAVAAHDLNATRRWSIELAAAAFSLDDLHRWLGTLVENQLLALQFQAQCETLFAAGEALHKPYDPTATISQYPAGVLSLNGMGNYYEVERQAERFYSMPADRIKELTDDAHLTPASIWMAPCVRASFVELEKRLSPDNRAVWEQAARTPYEHSYLVNMLYRANQADATDYLGDVLQRYDMIHPHSTIPEMMGALTYRGHAFAGLEWADRFQPQLIAAAENISPGETDVQAFMEACQWTNAFYKQPASYGLTLSLRDALAEKRLDCVRATDMIGAIYRDAGRSKFGNVRWCTEVGGHSVAAYLTSVNGVSNTLLMDGMNPTSEPEHWPDCYFHGHAWPPSLGTGPNPYAAELYVRGLDSYIWSEGYIARGPNAGNFYSAAIPYSVHHKDQSIRKVFDGPYPQ